MPLTPTENLASYDMDEDAVGLAIFIEEQVSALPADDAPVVYVQDQHGSPILRAVLEKQTLSDGSHVYNLVLHVEE